MICLDDYHAHDRQGRKDLKITALCPEAQAFGAQHFPSLPCVDTPTRDGSDRRVIQGSPPLSSQQRSPPPAPASQGHVTMVSRARGAPCSRARVVGMHATGWSVAPGRCVWRTYAAQGCTLQARGSCALADSAAQKADGGCGSILRGCLATHDPISSPGRTTFLHQHWIRGAVFRQTGACEHPAMACAYRSAPVTCSGSLNAAWASLLA